MSASPRVGVVMGSDSDLQVMRAAAEVLGELGIPHEVRVVSAHRTPDDMLSYGRSARARGLEVIVAGAGGAAHLPGMLAATTTLPVIGVPIPLRYLDGLDSLLSIVQMPSGVPVATVAIGGARNAGLLAARILALGDPELAARLAELADTMAATSRAKNERLVLPTPEGGESGEGGETGEGGGGGESGEGGETGEGGGGGESGEGGESGAVADPLPGSPRRNAGQS